MGRMGRYQLEAAIQSVHAARRVTRATDWPALCLLYRALFQITESVVVKLNWAVALAEAEGIDAGLSALPHQKQFPELEQFQPYHAVRADLLARAGRTDEALEAYGKAIALEKDAVVSRFLKQQAENLRHTMN